MGRRFHFDPLTAEQQQLVVDNLEVARRLSWQARSQYRDDAYQEAVIGLMAAARSYDPDAGVAFKSWAYTKAQGYMLDGLRKRTGWRRVGRPDEEPILSLDRFNFDEWLVPDPLAEAGFDDVETVDPVDLLGLMPALAREVLEVIADGGSQKDAADLLGITEAAVSRRLRVMRERLARRGITPELLRSVA